MNFDIDFKELEDDINLIKKNIKNSQGEEDIIHLNKIVFITNMLNLIGIFTLGLPSYTIIPWFCLGLSICARWTMIGHHTCHGGYDWANLPKYRRGTFALGFIRRFFDWLDWMLPEAWNLEHNKLHHYNLCENVNLIIQKLFPPFKC